MLSAEMPWTYADSVPARMLAAGALRATQGNGIIAKLTCIKNDPDSDEEDDEGASLTEDLPGRWSCRDTTYSTMFQIDFEPNGLREMRKENNKQQGRWRQIGERIEIQPYNGPVFQVENRSEDKLLLYFAKGIRAVCSLTRNNKVGRNGPVKSVICEAPRRHKVGRRTQIQLPSRDPCVKVGRAAELWRAHGPLPTETDMKDQFETALPSDWVQ